MNEYLIKFWPFFKPFFKEFPNTQTAGFEEVPFKDEAEYLKSLKEDRRSGWLWMDHQDLQVVANIYQMNVHILTTGVRGNETPSAKWTHLVPDERLKQFSTMQMPDMWLFQHSL